MIWCALLFAYLAIGVVVAAASTLVAPLDERAPVDGGPSTGVLRAVFWPVVLLLGLAAVFVVGMATAIKVCARVMGR